MKETKGPEREFELNRIFPETQKDTATDDIDDSPLSVFDSKKKTAVKKKTDDGVPRFPDWRHTSIFEEELDERLDFVAPIVPEEATEEIPLDAPPDVPLKETVRKRSVFDRFRQKKEAETAQKIDEIERIRKKSGFSDEDIALIFELGYEDDLGRIVGYDSLKKLKQDHKKRYHHPGYKHYRTSFGYTGKETINIESLPAILAKYIKDRKFLILRTVMTAVAAFILLFLDYPALLGDAATTCLEVLPFLFPILSFVILFAVSALSYRQLNAGLRSFLKAAPTPYSVPATTLVLVLLYDVVTLPIWQTVLHVNMLTASLLLVLAFCDVLRLVQEMHALRILATDEEKIVLEPAHPRKKKLLRGDRMIKIINDDEGKNFYRVQRAKQITSFFRRFNTTETAHLPFQYLIGLSIGFSALVAFIGAIAYPSVSYGFSSFVTTLFISAPATAMFSFFYPLYRANKVLSSCNCVLLGNESVNEYSEPKTVVFDDTDLYNAEKRAEIAIENSDLLRADLKLAGALFRALGGTLSGLGKTIGVVGEDPQITFVRISDKGVEALADDSIRIVAGSSEYLKKSNIHIPKESSDRTHRRAKNTALIHIAIDGVLKFTYEMEYTEKLSFLSFAEDLATINTAVAIESYDPALNEGFMQATRASAPTVIRVIKPGRYEGDPLLTESDTGAVAIGDKHCILYPLHAAHCVRESKRFGMRLQWFSFGFGVLLSAIFALFPEINILTPLSMTLYHGAFILISYLVTHLNINRHTLRISRFF